MFPWFTVADARLHEDARTVAGTLQVYCHMSLYSPVVKYDVGHMMVLLLFLQ